MYVLRLECAEPDKDLLAAELWERGTSGVIEDELPGGRVGLRAFFEEAFDAAVFARFAPQWERTGDRDWVEVAQSQWEPLLVGERFFLVPAWRDDPAPPGRIRLEMQPGRACGTGWHPATRLALEALERHVRPGAAVLDLGAGSGILAVAAVRLGAAPVCACDIDVEAVVVARDRFRYEDLAIGLFAGSIRSVRSASIDLVVANINVEVLIDLAPEIRRALAPGGTALLTGFPERHVDRLTAALSEPRFTLTRAAGDDWVLVSVSFPVSPTL